MLFKRPPRAAGPPPRLPSGGVGWRRNHAVNFEQEKKRFARRAGTTSDETFGEI